jgi:hypothetical protein
LRIGVVLPTFDRSAERALAVAKEAEQKGLQGAFCYDHLWPMGAPGKPAIAPFPLLGRLSSETTTLRLGTLVARIGLVADDVLVGEFRTLAALSGGRVIAALGTGDSLSAEENLAYGLEFAPAARRRAALGRVTTALLGDGIEVWVGAGGPATNAVARRCGATLNLFDVSAELVATEAEQGAVCWAGPLPKRLSQAVGVLRSLASAGATWAVVASSSPIDVVVEAATTAGVLTA